jgi:Plasmid pRiA4b ORF-3-like protein
MMPVSPAVVAVDLAEAALATPAFGGAVKLAQWVGPGRQLTARGVLRPADAVEACRVLGIALPGGRLRSAMDVEELMQGWVVAIGAGLLIGEGHRVRSVPAALATDPKTVLDAWVRAATVELGVPEDPCRKCLIVLHELHTAAGAMDVEALADAVVGPQRAVEPCPDCGGIHDLEMFSMLDDASGQAELRSHAESTLEGLVFFGAATVCDGSARLTPLGSLLAAAVFEGCAPAPDVDASTLISAIAELPPGIAASMARPWLDARSVVAAVGELLACAESTVGDQRAISLTLARDLGPQGAAAWRDWAGRPGFGAYARSWLADHGEPAEVRPADEAWLNVDVLAMTLDSLCETLPPPMVALTLQQQFGSADEFLEMLRSSGHPMAAEITALLTEGSFADAMPAAPAVLVRSGKRKQSRRRRGPQGVYQLKISLNGMSRPTVWRRVRVPSSITLQDLSEVIVRSMGWRAGREHMFEAGEEDYGRTDDYPGASYEASTRLDDVLAASNYDLRYTYDFYEMWGHEIVLEEVLPATPESVLPSCVAGKGACPPVECGGPWGYDELKAALANPRHVGHENVLDWLKQCSYHPFDPKAFSRDTANALLSQLTLRP